MFRAAAAADNCAKLEADIKARKLVAKNGKTSAACIRPGEKSSVTAHRMSQLADRTPVPMPDYCYDLATGDGTWWYTRTDACAISTWLLDIHDLRTGQLTGQLMYLQADLIYTGADAPYWSHQVVIDKTGGWGTIGGTTVSGGGSCKGDCTLAAGDKDFPSQTVTETGLTYGDILPKTTVSAAGDIGTGRTTVTYRFANPAWTLQPPGVASTPSFDVRCDNATPGTSTVGCVIPNYASVDVVSLTGPNPNYARHVRDAQASGLPGAYPNGQPLHRLTDATLRERNGNTACPQASSGGYPRPTGYSCDEYPFRSTWQGAATGSLPQPAPYPGRTFNWCQISALPTGSTGPDGWSACMIPAGENSSAGSLLNRFYIDNRVIEKDPFHVWIVD
ncbi:NucA/NucB deoxyribonuclease domain-containing protein [Streptomyces massasporeus]|uniref:NucA/NucB deoxyribonuclease domain-containing protein n=1 Tax=Streptomyces massasporeus TaxID=67324 RepID=UPI00340E5D00